MAKRFERLSKAGQRIAALRSYEQKLRREILMELGVQLLRVYNCRTGELEVEKLPVKQLSIFITENAALLNRYLKCNLDQEQEKQSRPESQPEPAEPETEPAEGAETEDERQW